ncbi:MAG: DUF4265 domain-containing protein [Bryobacteraceae bacterium]
MFRCLPEAVRRRGNARQLALLEGRRCAEAHIHGPPPTRPTRHEPQLRRFEAARTAVPADPAGYESAGFQKLWTRLSELGCTDKVAKRQWITIDVPSDSDVFAVYRILEEGVAQGVWSFEEAHCGHPSVRSAEPR